MKDSAIALVEAVRLARLELHCFRDPRCAASPEWTIKRLEHLLMDPSVGQAMAVLVPDAESSPAESPSIVPEPASREREDVLNPASL